MWTARGVSVVSQSCLKASYQGRNIFLITPYFARPRPRADQVSSSFTSRLTARSGSWKPCATCTRR